jgi:hypothetical protein
MTEGCAPADRLPAPLRVEPREPQNADERRLRQEKADTNAGNGEQDRNDTNHADEVIGGCAPREQSAAAPIHVLRVTES